MSVVTRCRPKPDYKRPVISQPLGMRADQSWIYFGLKPEHLGLNKQQHLRILHYSTSLTFHYVLFWWTSWSRMTSGGQTVDMSHFQSTEHELLI